MYAGAQFQNSPDPSVLPIPSFVTASPPRHNMPIVYSSPGQMSSPSMNPQMYHPVPFSSPQPLNLNDMGSSLKNLLNIKPSDSNKRN